MRHRSNRNGTMAFEQRGPIWRCTRWEHKMLLPVVTPLLLPAGRTLMRQGERRGQLVILVEGSAAVLRDDEVLEQIGPGSHVGGLTATYGLPHPTTVVSLSPVEVDVLSEREFRSVVPLLATFKARVREEMERQRRAWCLHGASTGATAFVAPARDIARVRGAAALPWPPASAQHVRGNRVQPGR